MKIAFIVNPIAGKGKGKDLFVDNIKDICDKLDIKAEIYITGGIGDGENFARKFVENTEDDDLRLIGCGGDGTLNEILNGVKSAKNIEEKNQQVAIGVIPIGTGNDFVRSFRKPELFHHIEAQLRGTVMECDAIKLTGEIDGVFQERFCANMVNIGFDCNVVLMAKKLKRKGFLTGSMAYIISALLILIEKRGENLKIKLDDRELHNGPLLLMTIANGKFCGGGIKSNPYAELQDGKLDLNYVNDVSRFTCLRILPKYKKGTHLEAGIEHIIMNTKGRKLRVEPNRKTMGLCVDGETYIAKAMDFQVVEKAFRIIVPPNL